MQRIPPALLLLSLLALTLGAQRVPVPVEGIAFDSVRGAPLANAFIVIAGRQGSATSDEHGRFRFDSVAPGPHTFMMQHAVLDSVGLSGISARVIVTDGRNQVRLAIPSFGTLWRSTCGTPPPSDSGFVYGTIRDERGERPVSGATMDVTWIDVGLGEHNAVRQRGWRSQTRSEKDGSFAVCGVPLTTGLRVQATTDSAASGSIDLAPNGARVQRRDLVVGPPTKTSTRRGTVVGTVLDEAGGPLAAARVTTDEIPEVRTGSDGRFVLRGVPAGTRQLEVLSVGMSPVTSVVDVAANDTAQVSIQLRKVTSLAPVRVTETARYREFVRELDERKREGFGYTMDSTKVAAHGTVESVFRDFPGTTVKHQKGNRFTVYTGIGLHQCAATLWIDGIRRIDYEDTADLHPDEIAAVEVYPNAGTAPPRFMQPGARCGAVIVWTKRMLK